MGLYKNSYLSESIVLVITGLHQYNFRLAQSPAWRILIIIPGNAFIQVAMPSTLCQDACHFFHMIYRINKALKPIGDQVKPATCYASLCFSSPIGPLGFAAEAIES